VEERLHCHSSETADGHTEYLKGFRRLLPALKANTVLRHKVIKRQVTGDELMSMSSIDLLEEDQKLQYHQAMMKNLEWRQVDKPVSIDDFKREDEGGDK